jgi:hypothetical protein
VKNIPLTEITQAQGIRKSQVRGTLLFALLAPDIIEATLAGRTDQALILERLGGRCRRIGRSSEPGSLSVGPKLLERLGRRIDEQCLGGRSGRPTLAPNDITEAAHQLHHGNCL